MVKSYFSPELFSVDDLDIQNDLPATPGDDSRTIRFSPPLPWILAIAVSVGIWAALGISIWRIL
jgi:hypothetical protein